MIFEAEATPRGIRVTLSDATFGFPADTEAKDIVLRIESHLGRELMPEEHRAIGALKSAKPKAEKPKKGK